MSAPDPLAPAALQERFAEVVQAYFERRDRGEDFGPFPDGREPSATAVLVAAANMLQAADVDAFELGMWMRQAAG